MGSPMLLYLAAAGVGRIGIVDDDVVEVSNLHRQVLYGVEDVGKPKVEAARKRLLALNPHIQIDIYRQRLTAANIMELLAGYAVVADGSDNFPTRYMVNDACVLAGKPLVYAAIHRFEGQLAVFNYKYAAGQPSTNYRDIFPTPPPPEQVPNCAEVGVLGVLPGIFGTFQALEVIKILAQVGEVLYDKLLTLNTLSFHSRILEIAPDEDNPLTGKNPTIFELVDYELFCGVQRPDIAAITPAIFRDWVRTAKDFTLLDVREDWEYEQDNLNGLHIPLNELEEHIADIPTDKPLVVHCKSGQRSLRALDILKIHFPGLAMYQLEGGIEGVRRRD